MDHFWEGFSKKLTLFAGVLAILLFGLTLSVYAQETDQLTLRLSRDFGYGGGSQIQGSFSLRVSGPENLVRAEYYIDDQLMGESSESPSFRYKFSTDDYPLGVHKLSAVGHTSDGRQIQSTTITKEFVSASEGYSSALKIVGIVLGLMVLVSAIAYGLSMLAGGRRKGSSDVPLGESRSYGMLGGTVCPKCGRPFSRHIWGMNIGVGKFDRCSHCGKWSVTYRATPAELRAAELAEVELAGEPQEDSPVISEEERLQKDLDDSRYDNI